MYVSKTIKTNFGPTCQLPFFLPLYPLSFSNGWRRRRARWSSTSPPATAHTQGGLACHSAHAGRGMGLAAHGHARMVSSASESTSWIAAALQIQQLSGGPLSIIPPIPILSLPRLLLTIARRQWRRRLATTATRETAMNGKRGGDSLLRSSSGRTHP